MQSGSLQAQPLVAAARFNWVIFTLFYLNRVFATLVSYGLRAYTWHYHKVYVDFHALQISPLGGRIFFKGFRYHGENETILIQQGYMTWRYWLRTVQRSEYSSSLDEPKGRSPQTSVPEGNDAAGDVEHGRSRRKTAQKKLPSRFEINLHGVEWFVYNRTAAYTSILEGFGHKPAEQTQSRDESEAQTYRDMSIPEIVMGDRDSRNNTRLSRRSTAVSSFMLKCSSLKDNLLSKRLSSRTHTFFTEHHHLDRSASSQAAKVMTSKSEAQSAASAPDPPGSMFLNLLPIDISCHKGAIVMGNENTQAILSTSFEASEGKFDASNAGPEDYYKLMVDLDFTHPVVQMRPNPDFKHTQTALADKMRQSTDYRQMEERKQRPWGFKRKLQKVYHNVRGLVPYFQRSVESFHFSSEDERPTNSSALPGVSRWQGLSRYREAEVQDEHEGWNYIEYGRSSTLIDAPGLRFNYHWDITGKVAYPSADPDKPPNYVPSCPINGSEPPEWGLHLSLKGGNVNYGPWADRERIGIQNVFLPNFYRNSQPGRPLSPGEDRQSTVFRLTLDFEEDTVIRIPTREPSKDWLWKDRADTVWNAAKKKSERSKKHPRDKEVDKGGQGHDIRPYGWLSLHIEGNSTMTYTMGMVPHASGSSARLNLDISGSRLMSSVNHGLLWTSGHQTINCDLSTPLEWNGLRTWSFSIDSTNMDIFLLRDHTYLISDLISDWCSGPSSDYYTFVPANYNLNLNFNNFRLLLNVNDQNIIDSPADVSENAFLIIKGHRLSTHVGIPLSTFQAPRNTIPLEFDLSDATFDLSTPMWNTLYTFMEDQCVATLAHLKATGGFTYHAGTSSSLTDMFELDITLGAPKIYLYGFLIRYLLLVKANYFGDHVHFKTFEEFQGELRHPTSKPLTATSTQRKANDLDVHIQVVAEKTCLLVPTGIYDKTKCLALNTPSLELEIRFTNYYMDFQTNIAPLGCTIETSTATKRHEKHVPQLFIDGVSVYNHRIFGPPPKEETYVCNWDFVVGDIGGECTTGFLQSSLSALKNFGFTIDDGENALPTLVHVLCHDITFLRAVLNSIRIWVLVDQAALLLSSGQLDFTYHDWVGTKFSSQTRLQVPDVIFAAVGRKPNNAHVRPHHLRESKDHRSTRCSTARTYAYFEATVDVIILERKPHTNAEKDEQQKLIKYSDLRTERASCLISDTGSPDDIGRHHLHTHAFEAPSLPLPPMAEPLRTAVYGYANGSEMSNPSKSFDTILHRGARKYETQTPARSMASGNERPVSSHLHDDTSSSRSGTPGRQNSNRSTRTERRNTHTRAHQSFSWAMPDFPFHHVQPDTSDVPRLPDGYQAPKMTTLNGSEGSDTERSFDEDINHVSIICNLPSGLRGYCSPETLAAVSSFAGEFAPSTPIGVLDNLHANVMADVLAYEKAISRALERSISNIAVYVPISHIRVVNSSTIQNSQDTGVYRDQYDIKLSAVNVAFRQRTERRKNEASSASLGYAVHAAANHASLNAKSEQIDVMEKRSIFHLALDKLSLQLASKPSIQSKVQIQKFDTISSSKAVGDIAALIERTTRMADVAIMPFQKLKARQEKRLRYLIHYLSCYGTDSPDPRFLTRPSYVLRAAGNHLRQHESWKILARLRNIYNMLYQAGDSPNLDNYHNFALNTSEARSAVFSNLEKWKSWDISQVKKSHVMRLIFGGSREGDFEFDEVYPLDLHFFLGTLRLCLDPGPRETFLFFENLTLAAHVNVHDRGEPLIIGPPTQNVVMQIYCSQAELTIRWEILELLEDILTNIEKLVPESANAFQEDDSITPKHHVNLHLMFMADRASLILDCINIVAYLIGNGVKGSIIEETPVSGLTNNLSVMVAGDTASVEIREAAKRLMIWRLQAPKYYVAHAWETRYDMEEDPVGLLHVANRLIEGEIKRVINLVRILEDRHQSKYLSRNERGVKLHAPSEGERDVHRFHTATFLGDYEIRILLLPSLYYIFSGEVSRLSLAPRLDSKKFRIDFDVKNNRQVFQSVTNKRNDIIASVDIPPINGRVVLDTHHPLRTEVEVDTTIELIHVDAGNVRNLLSVVRARELTHLLSDVKNDLAVLRNKLSSIMPSSISPHKQSDEQGSDLAYKIRLTMAGIDIHSVAPGLYAKSYAAGMIFSSGMIQAKMENTGPNERVLQHPEFHISVLQLSLDLTKRTEDHVQSCGALSIDAQIFGTSRRNEKGDLIRTYHLVSQGLQLELLSETASMAVDIAAYLQKAVETLDLSNEIKNLRRLKLIPSTDSSVPQTPPAETTDHDAEVSKNLFDSAFSIDLNDISIAWIVSKTMPARCGRNPEDLVFSVRKIDLATKKEDAARLRIADIQLQMVPPKHDYSVRSLNSILLPEVVFHAAYSSTPSKEYRLVFQAAGKALDIRFTSDMIFAASLLQRSIISAKEKLREAKAYWRSNVREEDKQVARSVPKKTHFKIVSLLVDAEFAGAVFNLQGRVEDELPGIVSPFRDNNNGQNHPGGNKYGPYPHDEEAGDIASSVDCTAIIRVPGLRLKAQYDDPKDDGPTVNAEILILPSNNTLYPPVVSLINQISSSIQDVVRESNRRREKKAEAKAKEAASSEYQTSLLSVPRHKEEALGQLPKPAQNETPTVLGRCKLNIGLRMRRQEFTLSCQPIARVLASAAFESSYITLNTIAAEDTQRFCALVLAFRGAAIDVKHVYSNDSTASLAVDSTVISLMNSKYVGSDSGLSAILKLSPVKAAVDVRQVQDFLLFGEIWFPPTDNKGSQPQDSPDGLFPSDAEPSRELSPSPRRSAKHSPSVSSTQGQMVQKYHQVATQTSFPWNSVVSIERVDIKLDMGQTVGRSSIIARDLWVSSKKTSDWEQHLCLGLSGIEFINTGRLDAEFAMSKFRVHSAIKWPTGIHSGTLTPLIQASASIGKICGKATFEYQEFLVCDITDFHFAMYNVRSADGGSRKDSLAATLEGGQVHVFMTSLTASLCLYLYQTLDRLIQGKREAYKASVKEIERFIRRQSSHLFGEPAPPISLGAKAAGNVKEEEDVRMPLSLHTDVLVNLQVLHIGVFPNTFEDHQVFKVEALDFETQFSVSPQADKIKSGLRLELGQLRVALSETDNPPLEQPDDVNVIIANISERSRMAKGGIILKVPKIIATMSTWQTMGDNLIEYLFSSTFQGKVDVGWNYSRISFIRNMWGVHRRALAAKLGKPLRQSAVQITSEKVDDAPSPEAVGGFGEEVRSSADSVKSTQSKEKITAVVNVPLSRYRYKALKPPVIDTPQLREMGEATPPLEWIGLNREKLPNVVHQIVMVTLTELATDVEDAYSRILGSSSS
ncbi:hypothetical protein KEM56_001796 [Ascosphaera pollenicola]|nr:hypothetical protein KEM56_001796 [Ascosphaera pollenicola]